MAKSNFRITFFYSDTGGGHRSAVNAIDTAVKELIARDSRGYSFELSADPIVEKSHPVNKKFVDLYNYLLGHKQEWMKYYYWFIQTFKPNDSELGYIIVKRYLAKLFAESQPDVIVSVHPMTNQYVARVLKDLELTDKVKLLTVVTDPNGNFWRGWACPDAALTVVPNSLSKQQLVEWGVPAEKIRIVGMPVNPQFLKPPATTRKQFMESLGLDGERTTIFLNSGWAGGGNMLDMYHQLGRTKRNIQIIFLCGRNEELYNKAKNAAATNPIPTAVMPYYDRMADIMSHVDLMVTKAGGLTTFEAISKKLPLVFDTITHPMPQELGTVQLLVKENLAYKVENPEEILEIVENFTPIADRDHYKLPTRYSLDRTEAVYDIARMILGFCDPSFSPVFDPASGSIRDAVRVEKVKHAIPDISQGQTT
ncbi:MAG: hypothetical protein IT342_17555 [Candidatus Melainabacteria bacterium]|nr:hypothetical protein [Candidatus Melainabacteria bacterium]